MSLKNEKKELLKNKKIERKALEYILRYRVNKYICLANLGEVVNQCIRLADLDDIPDEEFIYIEKDFLYQSIQSNVRAVSEKANNLVKGIIIKIINLKEKITLKLIKLKIKKISRNLGNLIVESVDLGNNTVSVRDLENSINYQFCGTAVDDSVTEGTLIYI